MHVPSWEWCWLSTAQGLRFRDMPPSALTHRYKGAFAILRVLHISGMDRVRSRESFCAMATFPPALCSRGRPPLLPRARAASHPAMVRSLMRVRSGGGHRTVGLPLLPCSMSNSHVVSTRKRRHDALSSRYGEALYGSSTQPAEAPVSCAQVHRGRRARSVTLSPTKGAMAFLDAAETRTYAMLQQVLRNHAILHTLSFPHTMGTCGALVALVQ